VPTKGLPLEIWMKMFLLWDGFWRRVKIIVKIKKSKIRFFLKKIIFFFIYKHFEEIQMIISYTFSKNMGIYGERAGAIHFVTLDKESAKVVIK
jgi:hypothetical protein